MTAVRPIQQDSSTVLNLSNLPSKFKVEILKKMKIRDLVNSCLIEKSWSSHLKDETLWGYLLQRDFCVHHCSETGNLKEVYQNYYLFSKFLAENDRQLSKAEHFAEEVESTFERDHFFQILIVFHLQNERLPDAERIAWKMEGTTELDFLKPVIEYNEKSVKMSESIGFFIKNLKAMHSIIFESEKFLLN